MQRVERKLAATRAKAALRRRFENAEWFRGVGIVPKGKTDFAVRLSVATKELAVRKSLPKRIGSVNIEVLIIAEYKARTR